MSHDSRRIIIADRFGDSSESAAKCIHHRDFPELAVESESVLDGLGRLLQHLERARESAVSGWHRAAVERAMTEVITLRELLGVERVPPGCDPSIDPVIGLDPRSLLRADSLG